MEEFFADAPLTPEQHEEDQTLYDHDFPFIDRILTAIQRFERTRKLSPERRDIFYKYLAYGGIDISPNMFQSVSSLDAKALSKTELAVAMSQVSIGTDKHNINSPDAQYAVDFLACMKSFLSRGVRRHFDLSTPEKIKEITTTLERFCDYLLLHDVCPEYAVELVTTRNFCRQQALTELTSLAAIRTRLPGDFNIACSTFFKSQFSIYDGKTSWTIDGEQTFVGFDDTLTKQIIHTAISAFAPAHIFNAYGEDGDYNGLKEVEKRENVGFEITRIIKADKSCLELYRQMAPELRPVGLVYAKAWNDPDGAPEDLTEEERQALSSSPPSNHARKDEYLFWLEQVILNDLQVGTKFVATVHRLNCGAWYFDGLIDVWPTFDTWLCNDLMQGYQKPRWLEGSYQFREERDRGAREQLERDAKAAEDADQAARAGQTDENVDVGAGVASLSLGSDESNGDDGNGSGSTVKARVDRPAEDPTNKTT
jgi:hypothetical protein